MNWWDVVNPFTLLGGVGSQAVIGGWTVAMLGIWNASLWLLRVVLAFEEAMLTPDLGENGPGAQAYQITFWLAGVLALVMLMLQLGLSVFRRSGAALATAVIGAAQYVLALSMWLFGCTTVLIAAGGLSRALAQGLLKVDALSAWRPFAVITIRDITDGTIATVLGVMGIVVILGAFGHGLAMLGRGVALLVLAATGPIAAAGLIAEPGRSWFWKSLRWFLAAAFSSPLMILVLGVGVSFTSSVPLGELDGVAKAIGTAVPGALLILVTSFAPLALFKLLAFVDPATSSGAAMRAGLDANGGLAGLLSGRPGTGTSSAASSVGQDGRSHGESAAEVDTTSRFSNGMATLASALGPVGRGVAIGLQTATAVGARASGIVTDTTGQMGAGQPTYIPDLHHPGPSSSSSGGGSSGSGGGGSGGGGSGGGGGGRVPDHPATHGSRPTPGPAGATGASGASGTSGASGASGAGG